MNKILKPRKSTKNSVLWLKNRFKVKNKNVQGQCGTVRYCRNWLKIYIFPLQIELLHQKKKLRILRQ